MMLNARVEVTLAGIPERRPFFSVVIPAYNQGKWLERAILSALDQDHGLREIIVVNDGSTDETSKVLAKFEGRVRVLDQTNQGLSSARNRGAREALGTYLVYLDSDDILFPWALRLLHSIIQESETPALLLSRAFTFRSDGELSEVQGAGTRYDRWGDYLESVRSRYRITVSGAIRRDELLACGGFVSQADGVEDHDLWLRLGTADGFVYLHHPPIYGYRQHGAGITHRPEAIGRGMAYLLDQERSGQYPGGVERAGERRFVLARLSGWVIRRCFSAGGIVRGYHLYWRGCPLFFRAGLGKEAVQLPLIPVRKLWRRIWRKCFVGLTKVRGGSRLTKSTMVDD